MKSFLVLAAMLFTGIGSNFRAQAFAADDPSPASPAEERLLRSAAALRTFRQGAGDTARMLLDNALCVGLAPRRDPGQGGPGENGFVSCRTDRGGVWSDPAAITIEGGGTFWPVVGIEIDLIILATNRSVASHLGDRETMLGSGILSTMPGPVRQDQVPKLNIYPVVFAYQQSSAGIAGINISGATIKEDLAANAVVYGTELSNQAILARTGERQRPMAADVFLTALSASDQAYQTER